MTSPASWRAPRKCARRSSPTRSSGTCKRGTLFMNRKVTVVGGAGNVGATVARSIANRELADVVIIDIADSKAQGIALDILQACPVEGSDTRVVGGSDYALSAGSD